MNNNNWSEELGNIIERVERCVGRQNEVDNIYENLVNVLFKEMDRYLDFNKRPVGLIAPPFIISFLGTGN